MKGQSDISDAHNAAGITAAERSAIDSIVQKYKISAEDVRPLSFGNNILWIPFCGYHHSAILLRLTLLASLGATGQQADEVEAHPSLSGTSTSFRTGGLHNISFGGRGRICVRHVNGRVDETVWAYS